MKIIFLMAMLISTSLYAGNSKQGKEGGNGGDVIVCGDQVQLLDVYEAYSIGREVVVPQGQNYNEMLKNLLTEKLSSIQPKRLKKYLGMLELFKSEAQFLPGIELNDIADAGLVILPKNCKLEQIIVQLADNEILPGRSRYTVSLDLWNKLDEFNKMALVLHEIIYREGIEAENANSMIVRSIVGQLLSKKITLGEYLDLVYKLSHEIEFKNIKTHYFFSGNGTDSIDMSIKTYLNNDSEEILQIRTKDKNANFSFEFRNEDHKISFLELKTADEKVLLMINESERGRMEHEVILKFLKVNDVNYFSADKTWKVTVDKDILYYKGNFEGSDFNISFTYESGNKKFDFNYFNVTELYLTITSDSIYNIGNFAFKSNFLSLEYGKDQGFRFYFPLESLTFIKTDKGEFSCRSMEKPWILNDCSVYGSNFLLSVNSIKKRVELSETVKTLNLQDMENLKVNMSGSIGSTRTGLFGNGKSDVNIYGNVLVNIRNGVVEMITDKYGTIYTFKNGEVVVKKPKMKTTEVFN